MSRTIERTIRLQPVIDLLRLAQMGAEIEPATYLTLGGGLGSFVWADHLRIHGVPAKEIRAVGLAPQPYARYKALCENSQIPDHERLRSDSSAMPDCMWGWPGYAVREALAETGRLRPDKALGIMWQVFSETALSDAYTPRSGQVFDAIDREAERIGWSSIWRKGRVRLIRRTSDGRYAAWCNSPHGPKLYVAPYLHIAFGYPRVRMLPDLQAYRRQTGDKLQAVNAYESHEHLYQQLAAEGGTVVIRGRGIVASRIMQRIDEVKQAHPDAAIRVLHLMRTPRETGTHYGLSRRQTEHHWQLQPYNFPKACFSGDLRFSWENASAADIEQLMDNWGGSTTARRHDWQQIVSNGIADGWYQIEFGAVQAITRGQTSPLDITYCTENELPQSVIVHADFLLDCTGLDGRIEHHPVLSDLCETYRLPRTPLGNLAVNSSFELQGLRQSIGDSQSRAFASGVNTLGGPYGPVDSFVGLQFAAYRSVDLLARRGAPYLRQLNPVRSSSQWVRWATGVTP